MIDLDVFRNAKTLLWKRWTVFEPHRIDDGTLYAYDSHGYTTGSLPLDTYTPDLMTGTRADWSPMTDNVGIVIVDPDTLDDVNAAVREWCRAQFGRDDVTFGDDAK